MKKGNSFRIGISAIVLLLLLNSCHKDIYSWDHFPDPLAGKNQVAEYHLTQFDQYFTQPLHYLFGKKFDHSGKVEEIICSFTADLLPSMVLPFQLDLHIIDKGRKVYLLTLDTIGHGAPDTSAIIYLNAEGRPDSCVGNYRLLPSIAPVKTAWEKEFYYYKDHRVFAVRTDNFFANNFFLSSIDTIRYDRFGNPLSFAGNSYEYDYSRKAKLQFYADDYMQNLDEFYLLQYLGYFPEITSPPNVRTRFSTVVGSLTITNHQFDAEGRLIYYDGASITWNGH